MLNEFRHECRPRWDIEKIHRCCPEPPPSHEPPCNPDCCYDVWTWELCQVNIKLKDIGCELADAQKHLAIVTTRYNRLKIWHDELTKANELSFTICRQLKLIECQLESICKNTCFAVHAVEILYCMIREFYYTVDCLQEKYDCLMNCIKCLNIPSLNTTSGIGKVLSDYGTALTAVIHTPCRYNRRSRSTDHPSRAPKNFVLRRCCNSPSATTRIITSLPICTGMRKRSSKRLQSR